MMPVRRLPYNSGMAAGGSSESRLLTLVFTDLVDSTGLKSRLGDAAALEQIGRHATALRELTVECG